jgi:hypothetical protein
VDMFEMCGCEIIKAHVCKRQNYYHDYMQYKKPEYVVIHLHASRDRKKSICDERCKDSIEDENSKLPTKETRTPSD